MANESANYLLLDVKIRLITLQSDKLWSLNVTICFSVIPFGPFVEVYAFLLDLIGRMFTTRLNNDGVASRIKCPFKLTELLTPKLKWN